MGDGDSGSGGDGDGGGCGGGGDGGGGGGGGGGAVKDLQRKTWDTGLTLVLLCAWRWGVWGGQRG